jgi:ABC-type dipeptide/oligopeptide/nickel transport system permease subunit
MIRTGASALTTGQWWTVLFPGLALGTAVASFNLVSEGIEIAREI